MRPERTPPARSPAYGPGSARRRPRSRQPGGPGAVAASTFLASSSGPAALAFALGIPAAVRYCSSAAGGGSSSATIRMASCGDAPRPTATPIR